MCFFFRRFLFFNVTTILPHKSTPPPPEVVDRGIALRQHLGLAQPRTASTLVHGLTPGTTYHFTVSCIAAVQGERLDWLGSVALALQDTTRCAGQKDNWAKRVF
jgi:hypothetical protein